MVASGGGRVFCGEFSSAWSGLACNGFEVGWIVDDVGEPVDVPLGTQVGVVENCRLGRFALGVSDGKGNSMAVGRIIADGCVGDLQAGEHGVEIVGRHSFAFAVILRSVLVITCVIWVFVRDRNRDNGDTNAFHIDGLTVGSGEGARERCADIRGGSLLAG